MNTITYAAALKRLRRRLANDGLRLHSTPPSRVIQFGPHYTTRANIVEQCGGGLLSELLEHYKILRSGERMEDN